MKKIYPIIFVLSLFAFFNTGFAQTSPPVPAVDIKANGSDGPITIPYNGSVSFSWTSNYPDLSCTVRTVNSYSNVGPSWQGSRPANGQATITGITTSGVYEIYCSGHGQSFITDVVTVTIDQLTRPPAAVDLKANGDSSGIITVPRYTDVLLSWKYIDPFYYDTSSASTRGLCEASGSWSNPVGNYKTDIGQEFTGPLASNKVYTLKCGTAVDTVTIYMSDSAAPVPTIAACDATSQAIVTAAGGCDKIDSSLYKNVYAACCTAITKESLLQTLDAALADGVLDKAEKLSLLNALDTYLSRL